MPIDNEVLKNIHRLKAQLALTIYPLINEVDQEIKAFKQCIQEPYTRYQQHQLHQLPLQQLVKKPALDIVEQCYAVAVTAKPITEKAKPLIQALKEAAQQMQQLLGLEGEGPGAFIHTMAIRLESELFEIESYYFLLEQTACRLVPVLAKDQDLVLMNCGQEKLGFQALLAPYRHKDP